METVAIDISQTNKVYKLSDLKNWPESARSLAVIGCPVAHSKSPELHNPIISEFTDSRYYKFEIQPEELAEALELFHKKKFRGLSVTVPHKVEAPKFASERSDAVKRIGASSVFHRADSGWRADNADAPGVGDAVKKSLGFAIGDQPMIILGAGGAARAAIWQGLSEGCERIVVLNRSQGFIDELVAIFPTEIQAYTFDNIPEDLPKDALLMNATSVGLKETDEPALSLDRLPPLKAVYDMCYLDGLNGLGRAAKAAGVPYADGHSMLEAQGAFARKLWFS